MKRMKGMNALKHEMNRRRGKGLRRRGRAGRYLWVLLLAWLLVMGVLALTIGTARAGVPPMGAGMPAVTVPTCTVTAGPGQVDFGQQSRGQLKDVPGGMSAGTRTLTVSLACTVAQPLKLRIGGPAAGAAFAYGTDGRLRVTAVRAQLDGKPAQLRRVTEGGRDASPAGLPLRLRPEDVMVPVINGEAAQGQHLAVTLTLEPVLGPRASRPLRQAESGLSLRVSREP